MNKEMLFQEKIYQLIESHREGPYWDFKEFAYTNNNDFVHDVLCMVNSQTGCDKYIIMGVSDPLSGCEIKGLVGERKHQADYIEIIRGLPFADARPEIELRTLCFDGKEIDVLIIYESPSKPFYLTKKYMGVFPYHIYTRNLDSNTPIDSSADFSAVEKMWRQRFELDITPSEKFERILTDIDNWHINMGNEDMAYYKILPDYQIIFSECKDADGELYPFFFTNETSFCGTADFKYRNTILFRINYGFVDEYRIAIAIPETCGLFINGKHHFYYYFIENSLKYKFHRLLCPDGQEFSRPILHNPFLLFKDEREKNKFDLYLKNIPDLEKKIESCKFSNSLFKEKKHWNMKFLGFAVESYDQWKEK